MKSPVKDASKRRLYAKMPRVARETTSPPADSLLKSFKATWAQLVIAVLLLQATSKYPHQSQLSCKVCS